MLDFSKLITPARHGEVLVLPTPCECVSAVQANSRSLRGATRPLLDSTIGDWRRRTREAVVGCDDRPIIVTGHQPTFIHPGVWAKHVVSMRLAEALDGIAFNLVVDSDAPQGATLGVPSIEGSRTELRNVRYADLRTGFTYEQLVRRTPEEIIRFEREVHEAMGKRYEQSQMPAFIEALSAVDSMGDGTDQTVTARRTIEKAFEVTVDERRVSRLWWTPLLLDMVRHAERFSQSYNNALQWYRKKFAVRGSQRPIPDLTARGAEWELPVWAYRSGEARRRLFVGQAGSRLRVLADRDEVGVFALDDFSAIDELISPLGGSAEWRLRPRALTLTIWARLFLADLFIHGIGGAKYDRISDAIIANYFGITPPEMACVSATLHLELPRTETTSETIRCLRRSLRDLEWNPQRGLAPDAGLTTLINHRGRAVRQAMELREADPHNRIARRAAFLKVRELNHRLATVRSDELVHLRAKLERAQVDLGQNKVAMGREYFFGLYERRPLELLLASLPGTHDFLV